jgi:hypothetical protein
VGRSWPCKGGRSESQRERVSGTYSAPTLFSISSVPEISSRVPWGAGATVSPAVLACKCPQEIAQKNDPIGISDTFADTRWRPKWWCKRLVPAPPEAASSRAEEKRLARSIPQRQGPPRPANSQIPVGGFRSHNRVQLHLNLGDFLSCLMRCKEAPCNDLFSKGGEPPIAE